MIIYIKELHDIETANPNHVAVEVNLSSNKTYQAQWSPEKLKVEQFILALRNTAGNLLASELSTIIEDYGQSKYEEGHDEASGYTNL